MWREGVGQLELMLVGVGGALGSVVRYLLTMGVAQRFGSSFPYGTFVINVTGSFLIGLVLVGLGERISVQPGYRLFLATGFLGGYTTFSTFSYDTLLLLQQANWTGAAVNVVGSVVLGLAGVALGAAVGRTLL